MQKSGSSDSEYRGRAEWEGSSDINFSRFT